MDFLVFEASPQPLGPSATGPARNRPSPLRRQGDPIDCMARLGRLGAPARQQLEQRRLICHQFFSSWRLIPGTMPATSQVDWLISLMAISVRSRSRATSGLFRSFGSGMGYPVGVSSDGDALSSPLAPPHLLQVLKSSGRPYRASASSSASIQTSVPSVFNSRHASAAGLTQCIIATR